MIIKLGFQVDNIRIETADEIVGMLQEALQQWRIDENNRVGGKGFSAIGSYLFEKSIANEKVAGHKKGVRWEIA